MNDYSMTVTYGRDEIVAVLKPDFLVAWMSFAIGQAFGWFIGKGVSRFGVERYRLPDGRIELVMKAEQPVRHGLSMSTASRIMDIADGGLIPARLEHPFEIGKEGSILSSEGLDPEISLAYLAYGMADTITAFFLRGAEKARYQISKEAGQLWVDLAMTQEELVQFMAVSQDYDSSTTLFELPWRS